MSDEAIFSPILTPAERILWTGRPDPGGVPRIWNNLKWYFVTYLVVSCLLRAPSFHDLFTGLIIAPAIGALGIHCIDRHFRRKIGRCAYAITTRRFLCVDGPPYNFRAFLLNEISVKFFPSGKGNLGTVRFQSEHSTWSRLGQPDHTPWIGPLICGVPDITPLIHRAQAECQLELLSIPRVICPEPLPAK